MAEKKPIKAEETVTGKVTEPVAGKTYTEEGYQKLQDEFAFLVEQERPRVKQLLAEARAFGDLSENSEYDEAKELQGKVEGRIAELEILIKTAIVVKDSDINHDIVNIGQTVTVFDVEMDEDTVYDIVGSNEVDVSSEGNKKISDHSPIGIALIGHKKGETVTVKSPAGEYQLKIKEFHKSK